MHDSVNNVSFQYGDIYLSSGEDGSDIVKRRTESSDKKCEDNGWY